MNFSKFLIIVLVVFLFFTSCSFKNPFDSLYQMINPEHNRVETWDDIESFLYVLQNADLDLIGITKFDLIILDYSRDGSEDGRFTKEEIDKLENDSFGDKKAICYMSIGEAENYRYYWKDNWSPGSDPAFLDEENPDWEGNYKVKYWDTNWQKIIVGDLNTNTPPTTNSYLGKIISEGFSGVYLDIVDGYQYWEDKGFSNAEDKMVDFIRIISRKAKKANPEFGIFPQNGDALGYRSDYLSYIDGIGRENVYFSSDGSHPLNENETYTIESNLQKFKQAGKLVLTIDYCRREDYVNWAYNLSLDQGFVPYCTVLPLNEIVINPGWEPK